MAVPELMIGAAPAPSAALERAGTAPAEEGSIAVRVPYLVYPLMIALLLASVWWTWSWHAEHTAQEQAAIDQARASIERISREISYRATLSDCPLNGRGWPIVVEPQWFQGHLPRNPLVPQSNPWLEIAGEHEQHLLNPPQPLVVDETLASFWYNPANGIVRARVGQTVSDASALRLYNAINGTRLGSLFLPETPLVEQPEDPPLWHGLD
jgi:hypothetical protein